MRMSTGTPAKRILFLLENLPEPLKPVEVMETMNAEKGYPLISKNKTRVTMHRMKNEGLIKALPGGKYTVNTKET